MRTTRTLLLLSLVLAGGWQTAAWSQTNPVTRVIPQIAAGSFDGQANYSTVIEIVNPNAVSVTVSGNIYNENGTLSNLIFTVTSGGVQQPNISNGTINNLTLDPNKVMVLSVGTTVATTPSTGRIAWARIVTTNVVSTATFFELRDSRTAALLSRLGVAASLPNMSRFVIPRVRNVATGLDVGFALVNTGLIGTVNLTVTLRDGRGDVIDSRPFTLSANSHVSRFASEFFNLTNEPAGTNYGYIEFDSINAPQLAAVAIAFEGSNQTTFPVDVLRQ